ncbi:MAG: hypothetical protein C5B54_10080, partial [Acidobacteria bacterium]
YYNHERNGGGMKSRLFRKFLFIFLVCALCDLCGELVSYSATQQKGKDLEIAEKTMGEMRAISGTILDYAMDENAMPQGKTIEEVLQKIKSEPENKDANLSQTDGWNNPFHYVASSKGEPPGECWLISYGSDGKPDADIYGADGIPTSKANGATEKSEDDIIIHNGEFIRYPAALKTSKWFNAPED